LPLQKISNSENVGGVTLTRTRSKKIGEVPGFEVCMPKKISEKAVNMLPRLI